MASPVIYLIAGAGGGSTNVYYNPCQGAMFATQTATQPQVKVTSSGIFSQLRARVSANTAAVSTNCRFIVNGVDGNMNFSVAAGATGVFADTTNTDAVSAGDNVEIRYDKMSSAMTIFYVSCQFTVTGGKLVIVESEESTNYNVASTTTYFSFSCDRISSATEDATFRPRIVVPTTARNLHAVVTSNTRSTNTTINFRKNAGNGNMVMTIAGGATGKFEDTSNTDSLTAGDYVNYSVTTGTGTGAFIPRVVGCNLEYTGKSVQMFAQGSIANAVSARRFTFPCGGDLQSTGTENQTSIPFTGTTAIVKNLYCYVSANAAATTTTVSIRSNAADTSTLLTIGAGATGEFNSSSTQSTIVTGDLIALSVIKSDTGSETFNWFTYEIEYASEFVPRVIYY